MFKGVLRSHIFRLIPDNPVCILGVEIKVMFCTQISSPGNSLMYSVRILGLPPRRDNL